MENSRKRGNWFMSWASVVIAACVVVLGFELYGLWDSHETVVSEADLASADTLTESFDKIIFGPNDISKEENHNIYRWMDPLRITVIGSDVAKWLPEIMRTGRQLEFLTGLEFRTSEGSSKLSNVLIVLTNDAEYENNVLNYYGDDDLMKYSNGNIMCSAHYSIGRIYFNIYDSISIIPIEASQDYVVRCIAEEMTQILGLYNDNAKYDSSVFSNKPIPNSLSINDKILVRTLYDPRIKPGMGREQALRAARRIITELVAIVQNIGEEGLIHPFHVDRERN